MFTSQPHILVVDDEPGIRRALVRILSGAGYGCSDAASVAEAREALSAEMADAVLLDVNLPDGSGLDLIQELVTDRPGLAVVMVSGLNDPGVAHAAVDTGAYGYISKPFSADSVLIALHTALRRRDLEMARLDHCRELERAVDERTSQLHRAYEVTIDRLARVIEYRDPDTGGHVSRMSRLCEALARRLDVDPVAVRIASSMHDVGKIGVPDAILMKPGKLDESEMEIMRQHTVIGHDVLGGSDSLLLGLAATIALTHHERWDGAGYPHGLAGEQIPLVGRIAAVADVFDAITSPRVYRAGCMSDDEARELIRAGSGTQFDPAVVDALMRIPDSDLQMVRAGASKVSLAVEPPNRVGLRA